MSSRRIVPLSLVRVLLLAAAFARAGVLRVAELVGVPITGRLDAASGRADLAVEGGIVPEAASIAADVRLRPWSPGPKMAGRASGDHVRERHGRVCGEVLTGRWLGRELRMLWDALWCAPDARGVRALVVGSCGGVSPAVLAFAGFPLAAGDGRRYLFATRDLRFGVPSGRAAAAPKEGG